MVGIAKRLNNISPYLQILSCTFVLALVLKAFVVDAVVIPSRSMEQALLVGDYVLVNKLVHGSSSYQQGSGGSTEAGFKPFPSLRSIERGDVVVFQFPSDVRSFIPEKELFVKRCIGMPGDEIEMRDGNPYVNGRRNSLASNPSSHDEGEDFEPLFVPCAGQQISLSQSNYHQWETLIRREGHVIRLIPTGDIVVDGVPVTKYVVQKNYLFVMGDNREHSFDSRSWGFLPEDNVIGKAECIYWSIDRTNSINDIFDFFSSIRWNRIGTFV